MGTWGYMPASGDSPHDMIGTLEKHAIDPWLDTLFAGKAPPGLVDRSRARGRKHAVRRRFNNTWDRWARVGIVQILLDRGFAIRRKILEACLEDVQACAKDEPWISGWRSPDLARKALGILAESLDGLLREDAAVNARRVTATTVLTATTARKRRRKVVFRGPPAAMRRIYPQSGNPFSEVRSKIRKLEAADRKRFLGKRRSKTKLREKIKQYRQVS